MWVVAVLVAALLLWKLRTSNFDWATFWRACRSVDWRLLVLATLIIFSNAVMRAARWSIFLKPSTPPEQRLPWWKLVPSQFIGFAGLATLGRIGELIRPYLVSRRTGLSFSSQIAVVAVERIFDLGAFGILFAGNLVLSPQLNTLPYHSRFRLFGYAVAGAIVFLSLFVAFTHFAGGTVARLFGNAVGRFSRSAGDAVAAKILEFRSGLNTIGSVGDFISVSVLSLLIWGSIALSYLVVMQAFPSPVHDLTLSHTLLLLGFSVVGGIVQLPGIGGGPQIMTTLALTKLFGIPAELATSTGIILYVIATMSVILPGLIFARIEHVSLRTVARASGERSEPHPVH